MNPVEIRLALLTIFYIQNARFYFMDEILTGVINESYSRWIRFLHQLQEEKCAVVLASHEPFSKKAVVWKLQDQKLISS